VVIVPLTIDEALKRLCPHLHIAWVQGRAKVEASSPALIALLEERAAQIAASGLEPASNPEIAATRAAYKALGKEPSRYRGSAEALARRVISGKGLYFVNNLVDVNNLISLETLLPLGSYDLGKIGNEVVFRVGKPGESYPGIGKDSINIADLPVFADDQGAFGSPTSDSQRSMITNATTAFAMAIISFSGKSDLRGHAQRASDLLAQHASGSEISVEIV